MNYLGLDYGTAHIGVALATGPLAGPLTTIKTPKSIQSIKQLITQHAIDSIVIGDCPESFVQDLTSLNLPIHIADETLSSHDARQSLAYTSQSRRKQNEHAVAACIILQSWLDSSSRP